MKQLLIVLIMFGAAMPAGAAQPNIVYILADDLGYGDVSCLNPEGKILTPSIDRLAAAGMVFTDAHSGSAVCTPTRYGLLTGRYAWRSRLKSGVLDGYSPPLIEPGRITVASMLRERGYSTACAGKWHLGMNWAKAEPPLVDRAEPRASARHVDYARPITGGPTAVGFDAYFGISASLNMPPFLFIEGDRATELPTPQKDSPLPGPAGPNFQLVDVLPRITEWSERYIAEHAEQSKAGKPLFLFVSLPTPHAPIVPAEPWRGRSGLNPYADFVMQSDATVGRVLDALDNAGIAENTIVIVTSDNGCSPKADLPHLSTLGHDPNAGFRGHKADAYEGGHRVPFIVRWPGKVKPGSRSAEVICLTDLLATAAELASVKLPDTAGEDSVSFLPAMLAAERAAPLREATVHHSINGSFAIRQGKWKLLLCASSGGWSAPTPGSREAKTLPRVQLYDLEADRAERNNLQAEHPEIVQRLTKLLEKYAAQGRSTPGSPQPNTGEVTLTAKP